MITVVVALCFFMGTNVPATEILSTNNGKLLAQTPPASAGLENAIEVKAFDEEAKDAKTGFKITKTLRVYRGEDYQLAIRRDLVTASGRYIGFLKAPGQQDQSKVSCRMNLVK